MRSLALSLLTSLLLATPLPATRLPAPAADFKSSAIHWPLPSGSDAHGYMAVPDRAHGPQPAIFLIGDASASDLDNRVLVRALAQAGFVACTLNRDQPLDQATLAGTLHWLAANRYATGKVALLAVGQSAPAADRLLASQAATVGVAIDPVGGVRWTQANSTRTTPAAALDWNAAWAMVTAFFREHLA